MHADDKVLVSVLIDVDCNDGVTAGCLGVNQLLVENKVPVVFEIDEIISVEANNQNIDVSVFIQVVEQCRIGPTQIIFDYMSGECSIIEVFIYIYVVVYVAGCHGIEITISIQIRCQ